ncbi:MAG: rhodanese-like domain-containing protein [Desulfobacteraceae bacterium]|nr:MAG: rhodanese-like domain-containing protein [Desulfobacteraceae bacterium]
MKKQTSFLLALTSVMITILSVWYIQRPIEPKQTTWEDVIVEAEAGGYKIITTEELADRYRKDASNLMLIDTRQEWEYRTGHIEGALNFSMKPTWWERRQKASQLKDFLGPNPERVLIFY